MEKLYNEIPGEGKEEEVENPHHTSDDNNKIQSDKPTPEVRSEPKHDIEKDQEGSDKNIE